MRLLIYAINGRGMGHLNRTLVLAKGLRAVDPNVEIQFVVGSPVFNIVRDAGFDVVKVPDTHQRLGFLTGIERRQVHLRRVFDILLQHQRPDIFVGDFVVNDGLFRQIKARGVKLSLILRKQRPEVITGLKGKRCMALVDRFLLPHDAQELPLSDLPPAWRERAFHLGPVGRSLAEEEVAPARKRYADPTQKLVVVAIGGGGFPDSHRTLELAQEVCQTLTQAGDGSSVRWVLVHGPYFPKRIDETFQAAAMLRYEVDLLPLMASADVVVCNAGYNTLRELELCGTPSVVIPLANTGRDDQFERARQMQAAGRALIAEPTARDLQDKLESILNRGAVPRQPAQFTPQAAAVLGERALAALRPLLDA